MNVLAIFISLSFKIKINISRLASLAFQTLDTNYLGFLKIVVAYTKKI